jgi:hypothetical protein
MVFGVRSWLFEQNFNNSTALRQTENLPANITFLSSTSEVTGRLLVRKLRRVPHSSSDYTFQQFYVDGKQKFIEIREKPTCSTLLQ